MATPSPSLEVIPKATVEATLSSTPEVIPKATVGATPSSTPEVIPKATVEATQAAAELALDLASESTPEPEAAPETTLQVAGSRVEPEGASQFRALYGAPQAQAREQRFAVADADIEPMAEAPVGNGHHEGGSRQTVVDQVELDVGVGVGADKKAGEGGGYINMDAGATPQQLLKGFTPLAVLTQVVGVVLVIMTVVWCGRTGFAWRSNPGLEFNWHPVLMVLGLIYLNANAILTYRMFRSAAKPLLKYIHGGIQLVTLPLVVIALVAVFDSHNLKIPPTPNMYSLHSWIGLAAVILFFSQYFLGLAAFLLPGMSVEYRRVILPYHVYMGVVIFALSVGASLIGLNEKAFFSLGDNYGTLPGEGVLINMIGVLMVLFALLVGLLVTKSEYKRTPLPEDASPLLSQSPQRQ